MAPYARNQVIRCIRTTTIHAEYPGNTQEETNVLDAAFSGPDIWEWPSVNKIKRALQTARSECLGRMWYSGHEGSPGAGQTVNSNSVEVLCSLGISGIYQIRVLYHVFECEREGFLLHF